MATKLIFSVEQIIVLNALVAAAEERGKAAEGASADFYKQVLIIFNRILGIWSEGK